ncbi:MAG TPA: alpha/beta hydrolase-fold protein [Anaerolineaceae bacterium]|nr:alpha/beta hydrolase-fold protein [Anaerolineaceae bacterium]
MSQTLIERALSEGTPLIDGTTATFIWQGESAPAILADFNGWIMSPQAEMTPVGEDAWALSVELPADAYIEYALSVDQERIFDPFNPHKTPNGFGKFNNYFYMSQDDELEELARRKPGVPHGQVFGRDIQPGFYFGSRPRRVHFYQPPVAEPCPLVVVWDGQDYLRRAHLPVIVDNLIAQQRIQPVALAMVENNRRSRAIEYLCSEATLMFLTNSVLPAAHESLNLLDIESQPGAYGVLGSSAGGLLALYTGLRLPNIFGKVLAQSGAYSLFGREFVVWDLLRLVDPRALKIWLAAGCYEMLVRINRQLAEALKDHGFDFHYNEYSGGHNYPSWRRDAAMGLEFLFETNNS